MNNQLTNRRLIDARHARTERDDVHTSITDERLRQRRIIISIIKFKNTFLFALSTHK